jgi:hypothetical protein
MADNIAKGDEKIKRNTRWGKEIDITEKSVQVWRKNRTDPHEPGGIAAPHGKGESLFRPSSMPYSLSGSYRLRSLSRSAIVRLLFPGAPMRAMPGGYFS